MHDDPILMHFVATQPLFCEMTPKAMANAKAAGHRLLDEFHYFSLLQESLPYSVCGEKWLQEVFSRFDAVLPGLVRFEKPITVIEDVSSSVYQLMYSVVAEGYFFRDPVVRPMRLLLYWLTRPDIVTNVAIRQIAGEPRDLLRSILRVWCEANAMEIQYYSGLERLLQVTRKNEQ
jgi:hypothetical protein